MADRQGRASVPRICHAHGLDIPDLEGDSRAGKRHSRMGPASSPRAPQMLRSRHEAFRSTLIDTVGAEGDSQGECRAWADAEARRVVDLPFDISSGQLRRTSVIRISPSLHLVVFVFHHISTDNISGKAAQYAYFCLPENSSKVEASARDYWRGQLGEMPEDGEESPGRMIGSRFPIAVPRNVVTEFEEFFRARSVTPFVGMLSVYLVLLRRWARTSDLSAGTQVLGRPCSELFGTIGFFFDQLLGLVSETLHDALDHQDVPFELAGAPAPGRNHLFQTAITYGPTDLSDVSALERLQMALLPGPAELSELPFDLSLDVQRVAGEVSLHVEFNRQRFSGAAMERCAKAYGDPLCSLGRQPDLPLGSMPLPDQTALTETPALGASGEPEGGRTPVEPTSAWDPFEPTAADAPEREAVVADGARLTFAEVAARARTMAAGLAARGVRTDTVVGICRDRRSDLIVADETFAEVETVSAATLLADVERTSGDDRADGGFARRPAAAPAYGVFTPGATGQPKGVVIGQTSLVAHATTRPAPTYTRLPEGRRMNVGAPSSLTSGVFERATGRLEVPADDGLLTLRHPPKIVVIDGEGPSDRLWQRLHDQPGPLACHAYGLNECTVESARAETREQPKPVAGCAAGTSRIYVVDDRLQLLPPVFAGEICVAGPGVAQRYAGQPAHISERFVSGRLSDVPVTTRGPRMKPAEVEGALLVHPAVAHAAVVAPRARTRLAEPVAYVVPGDEGQEALTPAAVREFPRGRLPSAQLPDRGRMLAALLTAPDGKTGRKTCRVASGRAPYRTPSEASRRPPTSVNGSCAGSWPKRSAFGCATSWAVSCDCGRSSTCGRSGSSPLGSVPRPVRPGPCRAGERTRDGGGAIVLGPPPGGPGDLGEEVGA
ncbi:AMP-binding protein [Streptomyces sp. W16]|uniref:AMP-binding protein n=1 Tax=Streptomyces sp. W16 TaxID=3076631 RepID=UPI00295BA334|nr:AMP-binding protein [Streptomyces sp. W16]MDV9169317.1 AMP-binding protein [Streptomyces sp. W16]